MKRLIAASLVAAALGSGHAQAAGSTASDFQVNIALTAGCSIGAITPVAFTYTAFQVAAAPSAGGTFNVACSNGLPYTFGLVVGGGGGASAPGNALISVTTMGLNYTLNAPAGGTGNGLNQAQTIGGSMSGGQAGICGGGVCTATDTHTLIVNF